MHNDLDIEQNAVFAQFISFWVRKRVPTKISSNEVFLTKLINISIWISQCSYSLMHKAKIIKTLMVPQNQFPHWLEKKMMHV